MWPWLAVALVLAVPTCSGDDFNVQPGEYLILQLGAQAPPATIVVAGRTDGGAVDLLMLDSLALDAYERGDPYQYWGERQTAVFNGNWVVPFRSEWFLLVDNSPGPAGGAPGASPVLGQIYVDVQPTSPTLPNAMSFQADYVRIAPLLGVAGLTLWMALIGVASWPNVGRVWPLLLTVAVLAFLFSFASPSGVLILIVVPAAMGAGIGYWASRVTASLNEGFKAAYFTAFFGTLFGADAGSIILRGASLEGFLVIGGAQFADALFVAPVAAICGTLVGARVLGHPSVDVAREDHSPRAYAKFVLWGLAALIAARVFVNLVR
jgi:hypothetical protein